MVTVSLLMLTIIAAPIASFVWQLRRIRRGRCSRGRGILLYALWAAAPVLAYLAFFFLLVGLEELFGDALVDEAYGRSLIFVVGGGLALVLLGTVAFSVTVAITKRRM